jgi:FtsH-binding integral membrane protein
MENNTNKNKTNNRKDILKRMVQVFALLIFTAALLFVSANNFVWIWGWIYIIIYLAYIIINASILPQELIAERDKELEGYKDFTEKTRYRLIPGIW